MPITFSSQDINQTSFPHTGTMVGTVHIDRWDVTNILIDNGSQAKILFLTTFDKMGFDQKKLRESSKPLYGFSRKRIEPVRAMTLPVSFGTPKNPCTKYICSHENFIACVELGTTLSHKVSTDAFLFKEIKGS
jgi:hypothetical protein